MCEAWNEGGEAANAGEPESQNSTAYNMSAGGPIVQPELEGITLTPKNVIPVTAKAKVTVHSMQLMQDVNYWSTLTQKLNWGK